METYQSPLQKSQASYPRNVDSTAKFCLGYTFRKVAHLSQPLGHELAYISSTIVLTLCARPHRVWPIGQVTTSTKQSAKSANGFESQQELITYGHSSPNYNPIHHGHIQKYYLPLHPHRPITAQPPPLLSKLSVSLGYL
jgi:hypothetical protein